MRYMGAASRYGSRSFLVRRVLGDDDGAFLLRPVALVVTQFHEHPKGGIHETGYLVFIKPFVGVATSQKIERYGENDNCRP